MGRSLAPLRDEGVFIIGSGDTFHNMRGFGESGYEPSLQFNERLTKAITGSEHLKLPGITSARKKSLLALVRPQPDARPGIMS